MAIIFVHVYLVLVNLLIRTQATQLLSSWVYRALQEHVHDQNPHISSSQTRTLGDMDSKGLRIAVCSTGHLRTFPLPGVYSALAEHLLRTAPGAVDLFLVGHLGAYRGNPNSQYYQETDGPTTADDGQFTQALRHLELIGSDHVEDTSGDCEALEGSWARDGITGRKCTDIDGHLHGNFMQMMWLDHCVRAVRNSGRQYDLFVRTRPDVGIFQPFPWKTISMDHVTCMQKDGGVHADWFFTVPWSMLDTWWDPIADKYAQGFDGMPDHEIFGPGQIFANSTMVAESNFPVVIVRGRRKAQCWRIVADVALQTDCLVKSMNGFWEELHS